MTSEELEIEYQKIKKQSQQDYRDLFGKEPPSTKSNMNTELTLKEKAIEAISDYLKATGWKLIDPSIGCETAWFQWVDPLTETSHRSDFAFVIQTDREISKKLFEYEQRN